MLRRALPLCLVVLLVPAAAAGAAPSAHAAKSCSLSAREQGGSKPSSLGTTYVTSLSARNISCRRAKRVVKAFHTCRHNKRGGGTGRCPYVNGYSCSEKRTTGANQYYSTATCKRGGKKVTHKYTQNT